MRHPWSGAHLLPRWDSGSKKQEARFEQHLHAQTCGLTRDNDNGTTSVPASKADQTSAPNPVSNRQGCCAEVLKAEGNVHLLITHKSILRALLCVALRLGPASFRAIDAHNGSVSIFK